MAEYTNIDNLRLMAQEALAEDWHPSYAAALNRAADELVELRQQNEALKTWQAKRLVAISDDPIFGSVVTENEELRAEVAALQARIEAARALHVRGAHATSDHFHCDPHECDRAGEGEIVPFCDTCDEAWPCATVRALAAVGGDAQ